MSDRILDLERRVRDLERRAVAVEQHEAWTAPPVGPTGSISGIWPFTNALDARVPVLAPLPLFGTLRARRLITKIFRATADDSRIGFAVYRADDAGLRIASSPPTTQEYLTKVNDYGKGALHLIADLGGSAGATGNLEVNFREVELDPRKALYLLGIVSSDANTNPHAPDKNPTSVPGWTGRALEADMRWPTKLFLTSGAAFRPAIGLYSAAGVMAYGG